MRTPASALAVRRPIGAALRGKLFLCAALTTMLSLGAGAAVAGADQDPIATAPAPVVVARQGSSPVEAQPAVSQAPLGIDAQIEAFIRGAPAAPWSNDAPLAGQDIEVKRQVHGQVGMAVGTGGYRSAFVQADIPIGETGMLSVAVSESRSDHAYGAYSHYGYGGGFGPVARQSLGVSLYLGDSALSGDCRRRATGVHPSTIGSGWSADDRCGGPQSSRSGRSRTGAAY